MNLLETLIFFFSKEIYLTIFKIIFKCPVKGEMRESGEKREEFHLVRLYLAD